MKQFCPRGHDTFVCGRAANHGCKTCQKERGAAWATANRERVTRMQRQSGRRRAGIQDASDEVRTGQCPLCPHVGRLVCDHDHATGAIRGWICARCNSGLGLLGDSAVRVRAALDYLERHES
jgi:hypothetical protein